MHLGFGLWGALQTWAWLLEGTIVAAPFWYAYRRAPAHARVLRGPAMLLGLLFVQMSPWRAARSHRRGTTTITHLEENVGSL